jgi:cysteine synthase A
VAYNAAVIFDDNSRSIGRTPLVRLNRVVTAGATVLAKIEGRNPAYSVKDRIGAAMVWDAEARGELGPGRGNGIVEATSGNTGIALAFAAASRGYACTLVMPDTMSIERRRILLALGAKVVITPGDQGMRGAIARADELAAESRAVRMRQFENPANPAIHERTTGPEIWDDTGGEIDVLVCGVGTGGTLTGVSRFIERTKQRPLWSVAVEPLASPVITQTLRKQPIAARAHTIQGIGAGFVPKNLDLALVDQVELIDNDEAFEMARRLAREEGILCGISSGAAVAAAARVAREARWASKTIVVVLPDAAERYLSGGLFPEES